MPGQSTPSTPKQRQLDKALHIDQILRLLSTRPKGLTCAEIARAVGLNRATVWRYFNDADIPLSYWDKDEEGRIHLEKDRLVFNVRLDLHEAMAVHLAVRLFSTRSDRHNPIAAAAVRKISREVEKIAPAIGAAMCKSADRLDSPEQRRDLAYLETLQCLTRAWANGCKVHFNYRNERSGKINEYIFSPYYIEPYAVGQTTYAFGKIDDNPKIWTFKIERILDICPLADTYSIPQDFDIDQYLANAWMIWTGTGEPKKIALKFSPRVVERVKETRWHHSQSLEGPLEDGSLIWRAEIANWTEMLPWIRGWGASVEVLEPEELRAEIAEEARKMSEMYRV